MNYRGKNISRIGNLDRCQSRFYSSYPVHRGITFNILPAFDFLPSTRKWKVSGRPSFQLSLVTSSNNRLPRALIELERSWLHELELHELITLRHFQPRTRMVVRIGPIYWNFPVIYQFGPFNGLITSWRWGWEVARCMIMKTTLREVYHSSQRGRIMEERLGFWSNDWRGNLLRFNQDYYLRTLTIMMDGAWCSRIDITCGF